MAGIMSQSLLLICLGIVFFSVEAEEMPIARLKPEYVAATKPRITSTITGSGSNFVFLQKFPLGGVELFYHTEVLVCPRDGFSTSDQHTLDGKIANMTDFAEIDESWWSTRTANCVELGYGGSSSEEECSGVPHSSEQIQYELNARLSMIGNADTSKKSLYIYGTGDFDGNVAYHNTCDHKCWSNWAGLDYNPLTNNCNTFTSTVLSCVYGLSQKKPHLGPSDLVTVKGHCPAQEAKAEEMPIAELKPEYVAAPKPSITSTITGSASNFVFLQKFPLDVKIFYHTEVLVCPRDGFSTADQHTLDGKIANMTDFAKIDESWWSTRTANCVELGYGLTFSGQECSGVPYFSDQIQYELNARRSIIINADTSKKSLYIYGTGDFDGNVAYHNTCDHKCWSNWAGTHYNPLTNNCNTFTSTVLSCVYGLSQKKPHLGPSDLVTVKGHCPAQKRAIIV